MFKGVGFHHCDLVQRSLSAIASGSPTVQSPCQYSVGNFNFEERRGHSRDLLGHNGSVFEEEHICFPKLRWNIGFDVLWPCLL